MAYAEGKAAIAVTADVVADDVADDAAVKKKPANEVTDVVADDVADKGETTIAVTAEPPMKKKKKSRVI